MSKEDVVKIINQNDELNLIYVYCIEKGKNELDVSKFVSALTFRPYTINYYFDYALTYYLIKYDITLLHDKNGKFIKAF